MKSSTQFTKLIILSTITFFFNISYAQTNVISPITSPVVPHVLPNNLPSISDSGPFIPFQAPAGLPSIDAPKTMQPISEALQYNGFMKLNDVTYVIFNYKSYGLKDSFSIDGKEWTVSQYTDKHIILKNKKETKKIAFKP